MRRILPALMVTTALAVSAPAFAHPVEDKGVPKDPEACPGCSETFPGITLNGFP